MATARQQEDPMADYWFNVVTHQVEEGPQSDWTKLLGPYPTREEAELALQKVQARNKAWDADED
ncbi:SPOR domain-containing protein [Arthrobacter jinronghuae]